MWRLGFVVYGVGLLGFICTPQVADQQSFEVFGISPQSPRGPVLKEYTLNQYIKAPIVSDVFFN